jgi:sec-independent protein translocase protein TatB
MFPLEQGAFEMILIGAIALIVVGPKDLPMLMRKVGQFTAKMRGLAAEFRASFDEMARQSELDELRKEVEALRTGTSLAPISQEIDQHLTGGFNPYPTGYPSPPETPTAAEPAPPIAAAPAVDVATPKIALASDAVPAAPPKKPRAPRKPKAKQDAGEAAPNAVSPNAVSPSEVSE